MKKILSIFLFLCLSAPFFGSYLWLQHKRHQVKRQVKLQIIAGLQKEDLVLLKFSAQEVKTKLDWKHSKEFGYKNSMYDIVEQQQIGDTIYYWCWWDYKETQLNRQLNRLVASALGQNPQNKEQQKRLHNFIRKLYYEVCPGSAYPPKEANSVENSLYLADLKSLETTPPVPPPRC